MTHRIKSYSTFCYETG